MDELENETMMRRGVAAQRQGLWSESFAAFWLRVKGYTILARRYATPVGEIDIIAIKGKALVFVEVKSRKKFEDALAALSPKMQQRIVRAAEYFISQNPKEANREMRFDLFAVSPPSFCWQHLVNAWRPPA